MQRRCANNKFRNNSQILKSFKIAWILFLVSLSFSLMVSEGISFVSKITSIIISLYSQGSISKIPSMAGKFSSNYFIGEKIYDVVFGALEYESKLHYERK